jgi:hypothetical protein
MQAQTKVTLVPAKSFHKKPAKKEEKKEEKQLSTAHLKNVELPEWYKHKTGASDVSFFYFALHYLVALLHIVLPALVC